MTDPRFRKVRSFVRRPGRITSAQRRALTELMPLWGVPFGDRPIDAVEVFGRDGPRVLDIGFGDGEALLTLAVNNPSIDYLGVEVHEPGIGHLLLLIQRAGITNVRVIRHDAVEVVESRLLRGQFDAVNLFFPDPWPKKRHHKRRLVQPGFMRQIGRILKPGGLFHVATDWSDYADHIVTVVAGTDLLRPATRPDAEAALYRRPPTKFERRGVQLGHDVIDLYFRRA